jgi:hypothetical protein
MDKSAPDQQGKLEEVQSREQTRRSQETEEVVQEERTID